MPPKELPKKYIELSGQLEQLADGIEGHSDETNFPPQLNAEEPRQKRQQLENSRQDYHEKVIAADLAYEAYEAFAKECRQYRSRSQSFLHGLYGKYDDILREFGFTPYKKRARK